MLPATAATVLAILQGEAGPDVSALMDLLGVVQEEQEVKYLLEVEVDDENQDMEVEPGTNAVAGDDEATGVSTNSRM